MADAWYRFECPGNVSPRLAGAVLHNSGVPGGAGSEIATAGWALVVSVWVSAGLAVYYTPFPTQVTYRPCGRGGGLRA